ncbi:MAG: MATE family efflux transporter [Clostridiales bacterium]|nr:MATE family efflux transporter [Clostridiales bacterium]
MIFYLKRGKGFYAELIRLAIPIILQNLITNSLAVVDTFMVGMLPGEEPMSAVTMANIPIFVVLLGIFGLQSGASVLISQFWGKKDMDAINRVLGVGMYAAGGLTILFSLVMFCFPLSFMGLFSNNDALVPLAAQYAKIVGFSYIFESLTQLYIGAQRSMEHPRLGLYILSISMCSNTFLNWVLIFGNLGAPALGVRGAALATLMSRVLQFAVMVVYAVTNRRFRLRPAALLRPGRAILTAYIRYATPVVCNETLWGLGTSLFPTIMGHMDESTAILAAFTLAGNVEKLCTVVIFAVAATAAILVGREIGAGKIATVYETGVALTLVAMLGGAVVGATTLVLNVTLIRRVAVSLFGLSGRTREIAMVMIAMTALFLPLRAFNTTNVVGVLRGGGDVRAVALIDLIPLWLVAVPLSALVGVVLRMDIAWMYLCMMMESVVKFCLGAYRLRSRAWIHDITRVDWQKEKV